MPDYAVAQQKLSDLRAQYNAELQRVEQDFNTKYEEFLEGQREFPETILHGIRQLLPEYDYLYLGDNARAPTTL